MLLLAAGLVLPCAVWPASVVDDRGATVSVAGPADRVVSLAPFITELVFAAGGGDRLVAVSEHSDFPEAARNLPRIGNAFSVNLEQLLAVGPDLVVSWQSGIDPRVVERLESMAIPVFVLEPREIDDVAGALRRLGRLLGTGEAADERADAFAAAIDRIRSRYAGRGRISVFYQISRRPLMTLNGQHMISDILALCGGTNVFQGLSPIAPTVNREQVLAQDPEVILVSAPDGRSPESFAYWRRYPAMTAVRYGNLYTVDGSVLNRQTPRLVDGVRQVCEILDKARGSLAD
jgi:iron complex transport system substrate-binding protein